jgi:allantoinase
MRGTVALNSEVCDDYPQIIEDALELGWAFMGHNQSNARHGCDRSLPSPLCR